MTTELRRILWRYQLGYCLKELIRDRFSDEVSLLWERARSFWDRMRGITSLGPTGDQLATRFEDAIKAAEQSLRRYDFVQTLHWFEMADKVSEIMKVGEQAAVQLTLVKNKIDVLNEYAGHQSAVCRCFIDLELRCRALFNEGQFRAACALAKHCTQDIESLITPGLFNEDTFSRLQSRIRDQRSIYARIRQISPQTEYDLLGMDVLTTVDRLLAAHRFSLGERLLEEAEDRGAGALAYLIALDQMSASEDRSSGDDLSGGQRSPWRKSTDYLLAKRLQDLSTYIRDTAQAENSSEEQARKASA